MGTMLPFSAACLVFGLLFTIIEVISRTTSWLTPDDSRKAVHILAGLIAACLPAVLDFKQITALGIFFIGFMAVSKKTHLFPSIHGVKRLTMGEVYYPLAIAALAWLFPVATVFSYAILVLALGDGFAAIVGMRNGKHPYTLFGARKSYEGSATFLLCAYALTVNYFLISSVSITRSFAMAVPIALGLCFTEAALSKGLDNLAIPLVAALLVTQLLF